MQKAAGNRLPAPPTAAPRRIVQPGPSAATRIESATGSLRETSFMVTPGLTLVEAMAGPLAAAGIRGGAVDLAGLRLAPFEYVIPARSPDADHVAYYSETHRAPDGVLIESGTATFGRRDGAPFLHAHALWQGGSGAAAGHILPLDTRIATPSRVRAWGIAEAEMIASPDPETNFTLFGPVRLGPETDAGNCVLGRLRPNEDLVHGIETLCRRHGSTSATVRSGIGSTIGSLLEGGARVDTIPTEFFIRRGVVAADAQGAMQVDIELVLVDETGAIIAGRPVRGMNPVLICAEIVLVLG
jgi:predicted DNA-binding protein with PD1-like motif